MDRSAIASILQTLNLNENDVTNIYHHGSWVYGTNSPTSDRDLLIVHRSSDNHSLQFWTDFDYFHEFKCHKLWNQYDISVYTTENFETLLAKNYLIAVQCVFLPDEFKIKDEIDYRKIYLDNYYNPRRIKQAAFYEMYRYWKLYKPVYHSHDLAQNAMVNEKRASRGDYVFKRLFHGLRYFDFVTQLIQTRSIYDYKHATYLFDQMKNIRSDPSGPFSMEKVVEFVQLKSTESKSILDTLVPTNIIQGSFEVYLTFDCSQNTEQILDDLQKVREKTKYKLLFVQSDVAQDKNKSERVIISSHYDGEYPSLIQHIEEEAHQCFPHFHINQMKIESLTSNAGVPENDIEKKLFWARTNHFAFYYNIPLENDRRGDTLRKIVNTCRSKYGFNSDSLDLLHNEWKMIDEKNSQYVSVMRLFNVGREKALVINDEIIESSRRNNLPLTVMKYAFIVHEKTFDRNND